MRLEGQPELLESVGSVRENTDGFRKSVNVKHNLYFILSCRHLVIVFDEAQISVVTQSMY